jgi:hypothetical protein
LNDRERSTTIDKERAVATEDAHVRASDVERDQVIKTLGQHTADGRLTMDEFEERVGEALSATSRADLEPVLRELPALPPDIPDTPQPRPRLPVPSPRLLLTTVAVILAAVMLVNGVWWIVFPLMGVFGGCGRRGMCGTRRRMHDHDRSAPTVPDDDRELIRV